jgi:protocatechuate 3,4-dioxygenase beta subunit
LLPNQEPPAFEERAMVYHQYQAFKTSKAKEPTGADIEGPFYKNGAPWRNVLSDKPTLKLSGRVLNQKGEPISATLDFWQADEKGVYDNDGFNFRGKQTAFAGGFYELDTVRPGDYQIADNPPDFRCAHIHVKLTTDGYKPLTTQLYFADDKYDATDHWFDAKRVIQMSNETRQDGTEYSLGKFDFVLEKV